MTHFDQKYDRPHLAVDVVCLRPEDLPDRLVEPLVGPREEEGVAGVVLGLLGLDGVPTLLLLVVDQLGIHV